MAFQVFVNCQYFNPRSPCRERLFSFLCDLRPKIISIHAPRAGSDALCYIIYEVMAYFNPRSPCRERPLLRLYLYVHTHFNPRSPCRERLYRPKRNARMVFISIHAPRAGSDILRMWLLIHLGYFNPRSPCRERHFFNL